jgi:hypothetical protein
MDIKNIFDQFVQICYERYGIGDSRIYKEDVKSKASLYCLNPYLWSEDDLKVKFGGFLELELIKLHSDLTVHSELKLYDSFPKNRADLSIHEVKRDLWLNRDEIKESLVAVI